MTAARAHLAVDLGAGSGRAMLGVLEGDRLDLAEVHRFENRPCRLPGGLHWDVPALQRNVEEGIRRALAAAADRGVGLATVGVDTWGVDYALISASGALVGLPVCYRDERFGPACERALQRVSAETVYDATGIQLMAINSLFQLFAQAQRDPGMLQAAARLLFMPDLFHFLLTGVAVVESTIASTSQMLDARTGRWASSLLADLELPEHLLGGPPAPPGTAIGPLRPEIAAELDGAGDLRVVTPAAHDTASAVAAVPAEPGASWCFISSGTWSLLGAELETPCVSEAARRANFTNELGVGGTTRFLKNITGLWILQECRRTLAAAGDDLGYAELARLAGAAEPRRTLIDPSDAVFMAPGDMPERIAAYARRTGQPVPATSGELVRCCLDSLALGYRRTLAQLESVLGRRFDVIHVVGGGGRNALLNQLTADATGRTVLVGPAEATAMGNVLVQALGGAADLVRVREIVRASVEVERFEPGATAPWDDAQERFDALGRAAAPAP
jgi:rhamnulokinase